MRIFHLALKVKCEECEKLYSRNDKLNNHMKLVHNYEPKCPKCSKQVFDLIKKSH